MSRALDLLNARLVVTNHRGQDADARCPAHDDRSASLTFAPGEHGGAVIKCHAGCTTEDVLKSIGMSFSDISPEPHIVATYVYRDEDGLPLWTTERWEPKTFRQRGLPAKGQRRLYHSEWLPYARERDDTVYIVEGEKDADSLAEHGYVAVCGVNGAGAWLDHYADQLQGLNVVVISDNDDPGKDHARQVVKSLDGKAASVSLTLPSFGKDVSDQLDAGYGLDTLVPLSVEATLGVHRADHIREREISWLWPGYLPAGKLVMVDGDPGDGKSVMTCDLAARFSTGAPLPDGQRAPMGPVDVVMISAEDDPEDTIRPRLRVAGANLSRVHLVTEGTIPDLPFNLGRDMAALEEYVTANNAALLVIDPLMAFMPSDVDAYRDDNVRRALHPLTRMGNRTGCSIVVVRHMTKGRTKAISAGGGSMGFIGAARVGYLVGHHPEDEGKRVLAGVKINIGPMPKSLGYRVISSVEGDPFAPPRVVWDDRPLPVTAQQLLDSGGGSDEEREAKAEARDWLHEYLCANHSGATWNDIQRAGRKEGHSEITLRRARADIAHSVRDPLDRDGKPRKGTYWLLNKIDRHLHAVPDPDEEEVDDTEDEPEFTSVPLVIPISEREAERVTRPIAVERVELPEFKPAEGTACDICAAEPSIWFANENVRRCAAHNPMSYGG